MLKRWLAAYSLLLSVIFLPLAAFGQGAVLQQGGALHGHAAMWIGNGYIADAGGPLGDGLAPVDPVSGMQPLGYASVNKGLGTCQFSGYAISAYSSLCWGFDGSGNGLITLGNSGGSSPTLSFVVNGTPYPFPGTGSGNVIGPTSPAPVVGDAVIWNGGTAVKDGGPPTFSVATNAALQALTGQPSGTTVFRESFWSTIAGGFGGYTYTTANCASPDNGLQISPTSGGGCWNADLVGTNASPLLWGATGSGVTITCSVSGSTMTCAGGTGDFVKGMPIAIYGAGPTSTASTPTITSTAVNGSGTTVYYVAVPIDTSMGPGAASAAASVSGGGGGGVLGTPRDFDLVMTGDTHASTTVDNLKIGGVPCTYTTCPLAVGGIVQNPANLAVPTTISSINSPTSIVVNQAATAANAGVNITENSPQQGVFNREAVSGSASSYGIYEGPTATLSSMTCVGVLDGSTTLNSGVFNDYGSTHYTPCPAWLPTHPPASALGQTLRTTIANVSGTTITLANPATTALASTAVLHDDTAALAASLASPAPILFSCGTYNIFAGIALSAMTIDGARCATIAGYGTGFDDLTFGTSAATGKLINMFGEDAGKSSGFGLTINGPAAHIVVDSYALYDRMNGIQVTAANSPVFTNIDLLRNGRGDQSVYLWSPAGTAVLNPYFGNVVISASVTDKGLLVDSDVLSLIADNFDVQSAPQEFLYRNTIAGGNPPFAARFRTMACNFGWGGPCLDLRAGVGQLTFSRAYLQCVGGGNGSSGGTGSPGVLIAAGVSPVDIDGQSEIFACDKEGVNDSGNYLSMGDGSVEIYSNSNTQHGVFDKVLIKSGAGPAVIRLATGDSFSSGTSQTTTEKCGVNIASGAGGANLPSGTQAFNVTTDAPGLQAPVCDSTATYGLVRVDGQLNSPTWVTNPAGGTLTTGQILGNQNTTMPVIYVSGNIFGTPVTWTTSTAASLVGSLVGAYVNQMFNFEVINLGGSIATLAGGSGVSVTTGATAASSIPHVFRCQVTNVGSPAVTCTG